MKLENIANIIEQLDDACVYTVSGKDGQYEHFTAAKKALVEVLKIKANSL